MKTVWLLTRGEYSDYGLVAVCDNKDTAYAMWERLKKYDSGSYYFHEPYEVAINTKKTCDLSQYTFTFKEPSGDITNSYRGDPLLSEDRVHIQQYTPENGDNKGITFTNVSIFANCECKAKKIAQDKRAEFLAKKAGI